MTQGGGALNSLVSLYLIGLVSDCVLQTKKVDDTKGCFLLHKGVGLSDGSFDQGTNAISSPPLIMEPICSKPADQRPPFKN